MKCHQCDRPAMYVVCDETKDIRLCLICYKILSDIQNQQFLKSAIMMNQVMDQIDMAIGFPSNEGRIPVQEFARVMQKGHMLNNITISHSQIGVLNTGSIEKIDAAITLSKGSDVESIGEKIKSLTEAVVHSAEMGQKEKNDVLDLTETLSEEVVGKRKPVTINALMKDITERVKSFEALATAAGKLRTAVEGIFPMI